MTEHFGGKPRNASFSAYLRTGRMVASMPRASGIEAKFNPWHDREDGKFTFAGAGEYFGAGSAAAPRAQMSKPPKTEDRTLPRPSGGSFGGGGTGGTWSTSEFDDPKNFTTYVVKSGDSLDRIAKTRRGLRASDLAQLNGLLPGAVLKPGQKLKVPNQASLENRRKRHAEDLAIGLYMATHQGKPPPDRTHVPSVDQQINTVETVELNQYRYQIDLALRTRDLQGFVKMDLVEERSRRLQANAGGKDRRLTDDGGHYVAPRFGGPRHPFNHFAQDSNFNRGKYRTIEDDWARAYAAGHRVFIHIIPKYYGLSTRPYELDVIWYVDGERHSQKLKNERQGK